MGLTDWIPGVSQAKSVFQLVTGDVDGAFETQKNFLHSCPGVAQVTSACYLAAGDTKRFEEINFQTVQTVSGVADGIPGVGHVKAVVHELAGDSTGAERAWTASTRTTCVMGAGAVGFAVGGPIGAVLGGVTAGATHDTAHTVVSGKEQGMYKVFKEADENPNAGNFFDAAFCPVADGMAGHAGGQMFNRALTAKQISANKAKLDSMKNQMTDMFDGKGGGKGAWQLGEDMKALHSKTTALERSIGVGEKTFNPKTGTVEGTGGKSTGTYVPQKTREVNRGRLKENVGIQRITVTRAQLAQTLDTSSSYSQRSSQRTATTTLKAQTVVKTSQNDATASEDPLAELLDSIEELTFCKDLEMFQQKVIEKFGFRLDVGVYKAALEFIISVRPGFLRKKRKVGSRTETPTIQKLVEESIENADEEEDGDEDEETKNRKLCCIQWNMCGFVAQVFRLTQKKAKGHLAELEELTTDLMAELKKLTMVFPSEDVKNSVQFLTLLITKRPHILLLNELKVADREIVEYLADSLGYKVKFSPSDTSGRAAIRGTAIAYRPRKYLTFKGSESIRPILDVKGIPVLEVVKASFIFHSKQKIYKNGVCDTLKKHNLTFVGAYLYEFSEPNFKATVRVFNQFEDGITIFAGDLNMEKKVYLKKWKAKNFVDMLKSGWKTNKHSREGRVTETEIDYVMVKRGHERYVRVFKPIKFSGRSIHYPIQFEVHDE